MEGILGAVGDLLRELVLPSLATLIGGLVVGLLAKYLKKAGLELTQAQQDRIRALITEAIRATEEASRREAMTSEEKRTRTIDAARTAITLDPALPDLSREDVAEVMDAQLPLVRKEQVGVPTKPVPSTPGTVGR